MLLLMSLLFIIHLEMELHNYFTGVLITNKLDENHKASDHFMCICIMKLAVGCSFLCAAYYYIVKYLLS
jgi:hypothetical protein